MKPPLSLPPPLGAVGAAAVIGGGANNNIKHGVTSAIMGGDNNDILHSDNAFIGGGKDNKISGSTAELSTIVGGEENIIDHGRHSAILGGQENTVNVAFSSVAGGRHNKIVHPTDNTNSYNFIGGGLGNHISGSSLYCSMLGTQNSKINASSNSNIVGGRENEIDVSNYSIVGGGNENNISRSISSVLGGGQYNEIVGHQGGKGIDTIGNFIGSGLYNEVKISDYGVIGGGLSGSIVGDSNYSAIVGGFNNSISSSQYSAVLGGRNNLITSSSNNDIFIVGSNITASVANTTHVQNLYSLGHISGSATSTGSFGKLITKNADIQDSAGNTLIGYDPGDIGNDDTINFKIGDVDGVTTSATVQLDVVNTEFILNDMKLIIPETIEHQGDTDTFIGFANNKITFRAGSGGGVSHDLLHLSGSNISGSLYSTGSFDHIIAHDTIRIKDNVASTQKFLFHDENVGIQRAQGADRTANGNSLYLSAFEDIIFTAQGTTMASQGERMRITEEGNVGIGDTSPSGLTNAIVLDVKNTSTGAGTHAQLVLEGSNGHNFLSLFSGDDSTGGDPLIMYDSGHVLRFGLADDAAATNFSEKMRLDSSGHLTPSADDTSNLGASDKRWSDVFAVQTTTGGVFETGLRTEKIGDNPTGTIVSWREDGLVPCDSNEDELVMGVIKQGKDEPIVLGAEPVLVTGKVSVGDYIVTSDKIGHGKSVKRGYLLKKDLFGKVIAQSLESGSGESYTIKAMIRKM